MRVLEHDEVADVVEDLLYALGLKLNVLLHHAQWDELVADAALLLLEASSCRA